MAAKINRDNFRNITDKHFNFRRLGKAAGGSRDYKDQRANTSRVLVDYIVSDTLSETPEEELNRGNRGICIKALMDAESLTVGDVLKCFQSDLSSVL